MDSPRLMVHRDLYPERESATERDVVWTWVIIITLLRGAGESAEGGRYTLMFSLSEGMIAGRLVAPFPTVLTSEREWVRTPHLPECWRCTLQTSPPPSLPFSPTAQKHQKQPFSLYISRTLLKSYWLFGLLVCSTHLFLCVRAGSEAEFRLLARIWSLFDFSPLVP